MLDAFDRRLEQGLRLLAYAGGLVLAGLALLVIYEIGARCFFGRPFRGGYEMTELAMSIIVACGLPYTAITRGHVSVDIFSKHLDRPGMRWLNFAVHALGAIVLAVLAWQSFGYAAKSYDFGDVSNMMKIPKFPFQYAVAVSAALLALVVALDALKALRPMDEAGEERQ